MPAWRFDNIVQVQGYSNPGKFQDEGEDEDDYWGRLRLLAVSATLAEQRAEAERRRRETLDPMTPVCGEDGRRRK
ncbi:hypothetical protein VTO73DRAFT_13177 [Trametes versicolor]